MSRMTKIVGLLFFALTTLAPFGHSQSTPGSSPGYDMSAQTDLGVQPLRPFVGTTENINVTNGNLNISIPLVSLPGRAHHDVALRLSYNSKIYKYVGDFEPDPAVIEGEYDFTEPQSPASPGLGW